MSVEKGFQVVSFGKNLHRISDRTLALYDSAAQIVADLNHISYGGKLNGHEKKNILLVPFTPVHHADKELQDIPEKQVFGKVFQSQVEETMLPFYPLVRNVQVTPPDWQSEIAEKARGAVREGYSVFSAADIEAAVEDMIARYIKSSARRSLEDSDSSTPVFSAKKYKSDYIDRLSEREFDSGFSVTADYQKARKDVQVGQIKVGNTRVTYMAENPIKDGHEGYEDNQRTNLVIVRGGFAELEEQVPNWIKPTIVSAQTVFDASEALRGNSPLVEYTVEQVRGLRNISHTEAHVIAQRMHVTPNTASILVGLQEFQQDPSLSVLEGTLHEKYGDISAIPHDVYVHVQDEKARWDYFKRTDVPFTQYTQFVRRQKVIPNE